MRAGPPPLSDRRPAGLNADRPRLELALRRWQRASGPFWLYVGATPFLGDLPVADAPPSTSRRIPGAFDPGATPTLYVVDLPPTVTLPWTSRLNRMGFIVVPAIQRWCTTPAVLAGEGLVALLAQQGDEARLPPVTRGVAFLLDGDRAGPATRRAAGAPSRRDGAPRPVGAPRAFDNRHAQHVDSLPPPALLRASGLTRVVCVTRGSLAEDLAPYVTRLHEAQLQIEVVAVARAGH